MMVLLLVVIGVSYRYSSTEMANHTSYYQQELLDERNKQLTIFLNAIEQASLAASRNGDLRRFLNSESMNSYERRRLQLEIENLLAQITYSSDSVESVDLYLKNAPTNIQDFAVRLLDEQLLAQTSWLPDLLQQQFLWIGEHNIVTNRGYVPVVSFNRLLYADSGKMLGVLVLNVKATYLQNMIAGDLPSQIENASTRLLIDIDGQPIAGIGSASLNAEQLAVMGKSSAGPSGHTRLRNLAPHDRDYLLVWSKFANSDWRLVEATPWSTITQGSRTMSAILMAIGGVAIVLALVFFLLISRQFIRPIQRLLGEMKKFVVRPGPLHLPEDYRNEFGVMFQGYRQLHERVQELYQSLEDQYRKQKEAEILALQAMINPHFLYNTLDQLNWIAIENKQHEISHILELMGKMFRIGLSGGASMITVEEELAHLDCYMQIQQIRWDGALHYIQDVPEAALPLYIPKLTLQPFVENAIIHGFHGREQGNIRIRAVLRDDRLSFTIYDDGVGYAPALPAGGGWKSGGYGIRNVRERMAAYFGAPYGFHIQPAAEGGTIVQIILPLLTQPLVGTTNPFTSEQGGFTYVESSHH